MKKQLVTFFIAGLLTISIAACGNVPKPFPISGDAPIGQPSEQPPVPGEQMPPGGPGAGGPGGQPAQPYEPVELAVTSDAIEAIMSSYSGKAFKEGEVPDDVIESILYSGGKAPSAMNAQPWHFTVVKNSEIAQSLAARNYVNGSVVIVVSGKADKKEGVNVAFDCALATQNMYLAAQFLGFGAHLYYGGVQNINDSLKGTLGIPEEYEAQIIMLVGYMDDSVDAVSAASARNPLDSITNYIK